MNLKWTECQFHKLHKFPRNQLNQNLLQDRPLLASALDSALAVALVIAAFDITGGYFRWTKPAKLPKEWNSKKILVQILSNQSQHKKINQFSPVLALGIKLGCGTNDLNQYVSHLIVYWVSTGHEEPEEQLYKFDDHSLLAILTKITKKILPPGWTLHCCPASTPNLQQTSRNTSCCCWEKEEGGVKKYISGNGICSLGEEN